MKIYKTNFKDLVIIKSKNFKDSRGFLREISLEKYLKKKLIFTIFFNSKKNVLRGLHMQTKNKQGKHVSVIKGKVFDIAVDMRKKSKTFGKFYKIILSDKNGKSLFIPAGFAHGFLGLDKENIVVYSNDNYRSKKHEAGLRWNDKKLKISWPKVKFIISKKDKNNLSFEEFCKKKKITDG